MNVLLLLAHSIAEYDDLRMLSDLGYDVFSIGSYSDLQGDGMRPALPDAPSHPELAALCHEQRVKHAALPTEFAIDWAKADLHPDVIDWADVIICHHYLDRWIAPQWSRIRHKRVIWRTCGQSDPRLEALMATFRPQGLEIVRYSHKERETFERLGAFAGEDALIRFGKYPDDWTGWTGEDAAVGNVTQDMAGRGDACGLGFWLAATEGLPARPAGPGSEKLPGGVGALGYDEMREYLRRCRAYLYTGTTPASYTLGLIEALMTGTPVVSIGPEAWGIPELFEGHELAYGSHDDPANARRDLETYLDHPNETVARLQRFRAIERFGIEAVGPQWRAFLGEPSAARVREAEAVA